MTSVQRGRTRERHRVRGSLRWRGGAWNAAVVAVTLTALTALAVYVERRQLVRADAVHSGSLLDHLARMPEFQGDLETATSHLEVVREALRPAGGVVELAPLRGPATAGDVRQVLAERRLTLRQGTFVLRYRGDPDRLRAAMRRSIGMHVLYGLAVLGALIAGTQWILDKHLLVPLRSLSLQLEHMQAGGGWLPRVSHTDEELAGVARAVADLGPALERQVREWIEAERRSAVALAIRSIRSRLVERRDGEGTHGPDRILQALADEEGAALGHARPAEGDVSELRIEVVPVMPGGGR